ncbi:MAG: methylmalonyl-CoA epimerase [Thermoanaerobaculum sp.]|nr:methylmalonyl-CoA epimerase [Thermoanaerobaculum sp.]MCX7895715.1 methylmalonyl-CoA epimerase [Thermoanaerobaculum sp.]MDW7966728.1 methylmalonyl-CoA epimerase [Thermoanaerobaculum sp.]
MIRRVHHIGVAVSNLEEATRAYQALGLAVERVEEVPTEQVRVAFIPVGETHIELLEPTSPASPVARFLEKRGPGVHHLCFLVEDVAQALGLARDAGLSVLDEKPRMGAGGAQVCFIHPKSTGGVLVELWQGEHA